MAKSFNPRVFLLRHAPTVWNQENRIQGHTDIPITADARIALENLQIPKQWNQLKWWCSPLIRARQTASALGTNSVETHPSLVETCWGIFEGMTLSEINLEIIRLGLQPTSGLDLKPPKGESPREVGQRLANWITNYATQYPLNMAVTHKGVIRAALSMATGWDMEKKFTSTVDWRLPMAFDCSSNGELELVKLNCDWQDTALIDAQTEFVPAV